MTNCDWALSLAVIFIFLVNEIHKALIDFAIYNNVGLIV